MKERGRWGMSVARFQMAQGGSREGGRVAKRKRVMESDEPMNIEFFSQKNEYNI